MRLLGDFDRSPIVWGAMNPCEMIDLEVIEVQVIIWGSFDSVIVSWRRSNHGTLYLRKGWHFHPHIGTHDYLMGSQCHWCVMHIQVHSLHPRGSNVDLFIRSLLSPRCLRQWVEGMYQGEMKIGSWYGCWIPFLEWWWWSHNTLMVSYLQISSLRNLPSWDVVVIDHGDQLWRTWKWK